ELFLPGNSFSIVSTHAAVDCASSLLFALQHSSHACSIVAVGPVCGGGGDTLRGAGGGGFGAAGLVGPDSARSCEPYFARTERRSAGCGFHPPPPPGLIQRTREYVFPLYSSDSTTIWQSLSDRSRS